MSSLSIYPVGKYITTTVRDLCFGAEPLEILVIRDLLMSCFKGERTINPKFAGKDFGASEKVVTDAIDRAERNKVLSVEYGENAKGYPQMTIKPTAEAISRLEAAKAEAQARFSR